MYRSMSRQKSDKTLLSRTACEGGCDATTVTGALAPVTLVECAQPNARRAGPTIPKSTRTLGFDLATPVQSARERDVGWGLEEDSGSPSLVAGHWKLMVMTYSDAGCDLSLYCLGQRH